MITIVIPYSKNNRLFKQYCINSELFDKIIIKKGIDQGYIKIDNVKFYHLKYNEVYNKFMKRYGFKNFICEIHHNYMASKAKCNHCELSFFN